MLVTLVVVQVVAAAVLYCRLYDEAPETAAQLTVAVVVATFDEAKPLGVPQVPPVVGGVQPSEVVKP